jgi:hypothetical protein
LDRREAHVCQSFDEGEKAIQSIETSCMKMSL